MAGPQKGGLSSVEDGSFGVWDPPPPALSVAIKT